MLEIGLPLVLYFVGYIAAYRRILWSMSQLFGTIKHTIPDPKFNFHVDFWSRDRAPAQYDSYEDTGYSFRYYYRHEYSPTAWTWFFASMTSLFFAIPWPVIIMCRYVNARRGTISNGMMSFEKIAKPPAHERAKLLQKRIAELEKECGIS